MTELTKEQQVRALREARFAKRHPVTKRGKIVSAVVTGATAALVAQIALLEAEVKYLKEQLARRSEPMSGLIHETLKLSAAQHKRAKSKKAKRKNRRHG